MRSARPRLGGGIRLSPRHSPFAGATLRLQGLDPNAVYTLSNFDVAGTTEMTGSQLMRQGLPIAIKDRPSSAVVTYKKKP